MKQLQKYGTFFFATDQSAVKEPSDAHEAQAVNVEPTQIYAPDIDVSRFMLDICEQSNFLFFLHSWNANKPKPKITKPNYFFELFSIHP